ncbi:MAG: mandelate racemase/muconate lactonizing enzyme family protein [Pseudomonadota bacterium]|nr:mandelate racemase/muconate lactonizing enzyme family protein [Pseudomonadota bacterium]
MVKGFDEEIKIKKLETFTTEYISVVKLTMEDESAGWGQMSTYCADISAKIFHRQVAPHVLGKVFVSFHDMESFVLEREHKFPGSYLLRAIAGLDTALWDWIGKKKEVPVTSLIGGVAGQVPAYASSMKRDITPSAEAQRLCRLRDQFGFKAFKFRVGSECGRGEDQWDGRTEEIISLVPKELGPDCIKMVDANSCYGANQAIEIGKKLEANGIVHFEEPCPYWLPYETKKVTDALKIDVTGGEQDCDFRVWREIIEKNIVDVVQPDVMYMGGLTRSLEIARMAAKKNITCTPHAANLSLVTVCTLHFLNAIENGGNFLEFSIEGEDYYPWQMNLFTGDPFSITDGSLTISDRPGWGVTFNPGWLDGSKYQCSS